jgi:hypothetical protein
MAARRETEIRAAYVELESPFSLLIHLNALTEAWRTDFNIIFIA